MMWLFAGAETAEAETTDTLYLNSIDYWKKKKGIFCLVSQQKLHEAFLFNGIKFLIVWNC